MYIVDVNKDVSSDFIFFSAFLDLQSIRDDEATTSKDVPITLWKTRDEVANSDKTMTFYFSENIQKLPISIVRTTDYLKGFLGSLTLRIIEV